MMSMSGVIFGCRPTYSGRWKPDRSGPQYHPQKSDHVMPKTKPSPDPLYWVNTDIHSYRKDHPHDKKGSAFFKFWLPAKAAYFTPEKGDTHDRVLGMIEAGDPIFAYEDGVGIVALGVVLEKPSLERCTGDSGPYPQSTEIVKRISVEWDTTVNCSTSE